jgi:hypothetical protein
MNIENISTLIKQLESLGFENAVLSLKILFFLKK